MGSLAQTLKLSEIWLILVPVPELGVQETSLQYKLLIHTVHSRTNKQYKMKLVGLLLVTGLAIAVASPEPQRGFFEADRTEADVVPTNLTMILEERATWFPGGQDVPPSDGPLVEPPPPDCGPTPEVPTGPSPTTERATRTVSPSSTTSTTMVSSSTTCPATTESLSSARVNSM